MKVRITLHGALHEADTSGHVELDVPQGCRIDELREHLIVALRQRAPNVRESLLRRSAFGTDEAIVHDGDPVPDDGQLAILPPVGGG